MKFIIILLFTLVSTLSVLKAQIAEKAEDISPLLVGEIIPDALLKDAKGNDVKFSEIIKGKTTVLVFYRGGWCPYCNKQLAGLATVEAQIMKLGYQIVAISPDDYKNIATTTKEDKVNYQVYSDAKADLMQKIGIAFKANDKTREYITSKTMGETTKALPVPTVMVINTKGEILFENISPNYARRISTDLLLAVLSKLEKN